MCLSVRASAVTRTQRRETVYLHRQNIKLAHVPTLQHTAKSVYYKFERSEVFEGSSTVYLQIVLDCFQEAHGFLLCTISSINLQLPVTCCRVNLAGLHQQQVHILFPFAQGLKAFMLSPPQSCERHSLNINAWPLEQPLLRLPTHVHQHTLTSSSGWVKTSCAVCKDSDKLFRCVTKESQTCWTCECDCIWVCRGCVLLWPLCSGGAIRTIA